MLVAPSSPRSTVSPATRHDLERSDWPLPRTARLVAARHTTLRGGRVERNAQSNVNCRVRGCEGMVAATGSNARRTAQGWCVVATKLATTVGQFTGRGTVSMRITVYVPVTVCM